MKFYAIPFRLIFRDRTNLSFDKCKRRPDRAGVDPFKAICFWRKPSFAELGKIISDSHGDSRFYREWKTAARSNTRPGCVRASTISLIYPRLPISNITKLYPYRFIRSPPSLVFLSIVINSKYNDRCWFRNARSNFTSTNFWWTVMVSNVD